MSNDPVDRNAFTPEDLHSDEIKKSDVPSGTSLIKSASQLPRQVYKGGGSLVDNSRSASCSASPSILTAPFALGIWGSLHFPRQNATWESIHRYYQKK